MEHLHKWVFAWNGTSQVWDAVKRENYFDLTNDRSKVLSASKMDVLILLIEKTDGDKKEIDKLLLGN
jgi:hypothetical protein